MQCLKGFLSVLFELLVNGGWGESTTWLEECSFRTPQLFWYGKREVCSLRFFVFLKTILISGMRTKQRSFSTEDSLRRGKKKKLKHVK